MPDFSMQRFEQMIGKKVQLIKRQDLEEDNGKIILQAAKAGKAVFLVPGDPFIATTHVTLRIDAEKQGIKTSVVHGISIMSAIVSLSGLHNYKFGKTVTVPFATILRNPLQRYRAEQEAGVAYALSAGFKGCRKRYLTINGGLEAST
jgi:diphthine synthase